MTNKKLKSKIIEQYGSQSDFAQVLKIHESVISRVIQGRKRLSKAEQLRWAEALGCKIKEFYNLIETNSNS